MKFDPDDPNGSMNVDLVEHDGVIFVRFTVNSGGARSHNCLVLRWPEAVTISHSLMSAAIEAASACGADEETIRAVMEASELAHLEEETDD